MRLSPGPEGAASPSSTAVAASWGLRCPRSHWYSWHYHSHCWHHFESHHVGNTRSRENGFLPSCLNSLCESYFQGHWPEICPSEFTEIFARFQSPRIQRKAVNTRLAAERQKSMNQYITGIGESVWSNTVNNLGQINSSLHRLCYLRQRYRINFYTHWCCASSKVERGLILMAILFTQIITEPSRTAK